MTLLEEGFCLVKNKDKIFDYKVLLEKVEEHKYFLTSDTVEVGFTFSPTSKEDDLVYRFAAAELTYTLVQSIKIPENDDLKVVPYPQNKFFVFQAVRCLHIRLKGPVKGTVCNKFLIGAFTNSGLGGQIYCPRCHSISYV